MDRRYFLGLAWAGWWATVLAGCSRETVAPVVARTKPIIELNSGVDATDPVYVDAARLFIEGPDRILACYAPWGEDFTIGSVMGYFRQQFKQPVGTERSQTLASRYIYHLEGVGVHAQSIPTWLYAVYPRTLGRLDEDDWYTRLGSAYVDLEPLPRGSIVDWRLAIP